MRIVMRKLLSVAALVLGSCLRRGLVATDVAGRRKSGTAPARTPAPAPARGSRGGKPPTQVVVHDPGGGRPRTVKLTGSADVGRGDACAIRVQDSYVSQVHARLSSKDGSWYVEDLGSTNGTFVNDQKLAAPALVQPGDRIRVGTTVLELRR